MPTITYGSPETAEENPPTARVSVLNGLIRTLEAELLAFQASLALESAKCNHHFVPTPEAIHYIPRTSDERVFDAGEMITSPGTDRRNSTMTFSLVCSRCKEHRTEALSAHCPVCASPTTGQWAEGTFDTYFKMSSPGRNGSRPWLISCSSCDFRAVAKLYSP